jgi:hypothetical protein
MSKYEKRLGREIHLMIFEQKKIPSNLKASLINGVVLEGVLDLK